MAPADELPDVRDGLDPMQRAVLRATAEVEDVRRALYAQTRLETAVEVRALASVDGAPTTMPMLALVDRYIADQRGWLRAAGTTPERLIDDAIKARIADLAARFGGSRRTEIVGHFD